MLCPNCQSEIVYDEPQEQFICPNGHELEIIQPVVLTWREQIEVFAKHTWLPLLLWAIALSVLVLRRDNVVLSFIAGASMMAILAYGYGFVVDPLPFVPASTSDSAPPPS